MVFSWVHDREIPPLTGRDCHDVVVVYRALSSINGAVCDRTCVVDVEDCGAAYRFLMPLLAATPGRFLLTGTPRLLHRPIEPLVRVLQAVGAEIRKTEDGWLIVGKSLRTNELEIDARQSSQMASALVLAAPLYGLQTLRLTQTDIPSLSYLRMTLACTKAFPVRILGVEMPDTPIGAPGDWSAALFWFAHARLHPQNRYRLSELSLESVQGDSVICQWFRDVNMSILTDGLSLVVKADSLERRPEMVLDVRDCLDTVPVMAALAALLPADITFRHVGNLQYKESDRLRALVEQLRPYADISSSDEHLRVCGRSANPSAVSRFNTYHDHRLAMAFLLFGRPDLLDDTDCLRKSYPGLLQDLNFEP